MNWFRRPYLLVLVILFSSVLSAQVYTVNTDDDVFNGVCNSVHCSLREAIDAAEKDTVPSTILFNIPGPGPHKIVPLAPFPDITQPDLTIKGESQPGGPGSILIDFQYRDFQNIRFWNILAPRFSMSGLDFVHFFFNNANDVLLQLGLPTKHADNSRISNCSFISDSFGSIHPEYYLIQIWFANQFTISNCNFGTDHTRSFIANVHKGIDAWQVNEKNITIIDSNLFLTKLIGVQYGEHFIARRNIFGTLDTTDKLNYQSSDFGFYYQSIFSNQKIQLSNNYFTGFQGAAINVVAVSQEDLNISSNQFINNEIDINLYQNDNGFSLDGSFTIANNVARNGRTFLTTNNIFEITLENNNIRNYDTAFHCRMSINTIKNGARRIRHFDNKMFCINKYLVDVIPKILPWWHAIPVISTVNRNQITGTGLPNDSIVLYFNQDTNCNNVLCMGGEELGRTRADGLGNWILNVQYPNKSTISAYQFDSDTSKRPLIYSEFSSCYQCPGIVHTNYSQTICPGESINYRGHTFSNLNPVDSFLITGDSVSICDSIFLVNLIVKPSIRSHIDLQICFNDTLNFGTVLIHQNHLSDSIILQSATGCDSTVTINAVIVGRNKLSRSICENDTLKIGNTIFNKDHFAGPAIIKGGSSLGCDSIVDVNLSINNSFSVDLPNDTTVHKGNPITIKPFVNFIPSSIKWSPNLYLDCDTCLYPISKPENNITYQLTAKDPNGCDVSDLITISILVDNAEIFIPNAFSPNGDNINDIFQPIFKFPNSTAIKEFRIYDRWGDQIYQRLDGAIGDIFGWDGTANGDKMNPGVYIYWIQFAGEDNVIKVKTGDVTLVR